VFRPLLVDAILSKVHDPGEITLVPARTVGQKYVNKR